MFLSLLGIFTQTITPVIGIALIGFFFAGRFHLDSRTLGKTTYNFFIPAFVFHTFALSDQLVNEILVVLPAIFAIQILLCVSAFSIAKIMRRTREITAAYVISTVFPNIGNFALPVLIFQYGDRITAPATLFFLLILMHSFFFAVFFADQKSGIKKGCVSVLKTPAVIAFFGGLLFSQIGVSLPVPVERITGLMGDAMIPVMLFTIGAQLSEIKQFRIDTDIIVMVVLRLIVGPAIAFFVLLFFNLGETYSNIALIDYAMPSALLASIIATEYGIAKDKITMVVLYTSLLSVFTLTVLLGVL